MSEPEVKWSCEYCTYKNFPSSLKCTMCRGPKPLLNEDIYRLHGSDVIDREISTNLSGIASGPCETRSNGKWSCEACTYLNLSRDQICTQCGTPIPLDKHTASTITDTTLHEHIQPLRISHSPTTPPHSQSQLISAYSPTQTSDVAQAQSLLSSQQRSASRNSINSAENVAGSPPHTSTTNVENQRRSQQKWMCLVCTYENWPRTLKCAMCLSPHPAHIISPQNVPSTPSTIAPSPNIPTSPISSIYNQSPPSRYLDYHDTSSHIGGLTPGGGNNNNNCDLERRMRQLRRQADWAWLNACLGVLEGDVNPVEAYLNSGGDPARQLTASEVALLNRSSAFDVGHTLVHLAIRFHREDMLATLLSQIEGGGSGVKRVPSYVAPDIATDIRRHMSSTIRQRKGSFPCNFVTELPTFALPAEVEELPGTVQEQLFSELLDKDAQQQLEGDSPVVNWSLEVTVRLGSRLYALWNRSAGDCLLDSAMQATWGVFDRDNTLRRAMAESLHQGGHIFYPRWKEYESSQASLLHFSLDEAQWEEDWTSLLSLASQPGASLEQLHVWALAHVLRRPIIVYGVKYVKSFRGEALGYARFEGVYLPLLWEASFCVRTPLALGYTRGHFSALVPMEPEAHPHAGLDHPDTLQITFLPLMDRERKLLPVHFLTQVEMGREESILRQWLDVCETEGGILVAQQRLHKRPLLVAQMVEEWLNHYRRLAQMTSAPFARPLPIQDYSSDGDTDDE